MMIMLRVYTIYMAEKHTALLSWKGQAVLNLNKVSRRSVEWTRVIVFSAQNLLAACKMLGLEKIMVAQLSTRIIIYKKW